MSPEQYRIRLSDAKSSSGFSVITQPYSQTVLPKTKRRSGTSGEFGVRYEKKILMLALYRALKEGYDFTLDTNIERVGTFDDVVFTYKESDGIEQRIYLQAKHKEDECKKIKYEDLLKEGNEEYALYKYFIDYAETLRNFKKIQNKYFIIYTNVDFQCPKEDAKGFRTHKKSETEYFIFRKLDLSEHKPLKIFFAFDSKSSKKYPAFYQFSETNQNGEHEKSRVVNFLKNKFRTIDEGKKLLTTINENELEFLLEGYIQSLIFAVDQLNQAKLGSQIKEEVKQVHFHSLTQDHVDYIYEYSLNKIGQWKDRSKAVPLTERDNFFSQGEDKFKTFSAWYTTLVYENELNVSNIRFKREKHKEMDNFISSNEKVWLISSNSSWLSSLIIYQALNEERGINYANHDHHLFLIWSDLLKNHKLLLSTFRTMAQSLLIIVCEFPYRVNPETPEIVKEILAIVSTSDMKKVIVIAPNMFELSKQLKQNLNSSYDEEHNIKIRDLTLESQKTCLTTNKIRFQGQNDQISILQLLHLEEHFPVSEEVLTKLNLSTSELETLLKKPVVEIGNEYPKLSHLESAYYKTGKFIDLKRLKEALVANPQDIFAFVAEENEIESCLSDLQKPLTRFDDEFTQIYGGCIILNAGQEEEEFKQLCYKADDVGRNVAKSASHLLKKRRNGWMWNRTYSSEFYMERCFYPVVIDAKKVKDALVQESFLFSFIIFSGTNEEVLLDFLNLRTDTDVEREKIRKNTAVFLEEANAQEKFDRLVSDLNRNISIHWLKVHEAKGQKQLHWYRSQGDVSQLLKILVTDSTVNMPFTEADLAKSTKRVLVLSDEPGMGKTSSLLRISELVKSYKPLSWVMKFSLNQHQVLLASKQVKTVDDLVDLLTSIDRKLADPLTRRLLIYQLNCPGHVVLLWDGFDEIKSDRQDTVLALFEFIKKRTSATIWITTRRHDQRKLEESLSTLAHRFEPLDKTKQINFLSRFWTITLTLSGKNPDISFLRKFANDVIQGFEQSIHTFQEGRCFISIPLRARILAEIYQEVVENALLESKPYLKCFKPEHLSLGNLYQQFISKKYDIYLREKVAIGEGLDEESRSFLMWGYSIAYGLFAVKELFGSWEIELPISYGKELFSLNVLSRIGLIQGNEKPVNFIHRTFAEYFAGKLLAEQTKNSEVKKFLAVQLFKKEFGVVRRFCDHFLTHNLQLHRAILEGHMLTLQESLSKNYDINIADSLGRTVLHLAAQEGRCEIIQNLQKTSGIKFTRDQLGKTALHYAARFGSDKIIDQLLENINDIDPNDYILSPLNFNAEIGNSIFNNPACAKSKLVQLVNEKDKAGRTPLYYAADNEKQEAGCTLISYGADVSVFTNKQTGDLLRFVTQMDPGNEIKLNRKCNLLSIVGLLSNQIPKNEIYDYLHFLSRFFTYGHNDTIDALLKIIDIEEKRFQIPNKPYNFLPFFRLIIRSRLLTHPNTNSKSSDAHFLKIVKYFCEYGREFGLEIREDIYEYLFAASLHGFSKTFNYLCEYGEKVTDLSKPEKIKSHKVVIYELFSIVQDLNYDNPWFQNLLSASFKIFGWTRLHLATVNKNIHSIEDFLKIPSDMQFILSYILIPFSKYHIYKYINSKDIDGYTPLAIAALCGKSEFIESSFAALKALNLNDKNQLYKIVNTKTDSHYGRTPLHRVIYKEDYASAVVLLKNIKGIGFDQEQLFNIFDSRDTANSNPIAFVHTLGSTVKTAEILELLFQYIKYFNFSSQHCVEILKGSRCLLYRLISHARVRQTLSLLRGIKKLPLADSERTEIVSEPSWVDNNTPLHAAATSAGFSRKIIHSLLKIGAIFNAYNRVKKTPLDFVIELKEKMEETYRNHPSQQAFPLFSGSKDSLVVITTKDLERTEFLLSSINKLFELNADQQTIHVSEKLGEIKDTLSEIKKESWIEPESVLNARNREGKTLLELSQYQEVTDLLRELNCQI